MNERKRKGERGSVVMEAALVMPIVILLFAGILEFGRMLMIQQILTNAAREGARMGALYMDDSKALAEAGTVAQDYLTRCGINSELISVEPAFSTVNGTQAVQLKINYDYTSTLAGWVPGIDHNLELHSLSIMRREA